MAVSDWSTSAALNLSVGGVSIAEGAARANMNNMGRAIMAEAKAQFDTLSGIRLTPEQYGANGLAATDQTTAMEAMMVAARLAVNATIVLTEGKTYTYTNPFIWGGLRNLTVLGNRAKLMNFRTSAAGIQDANIQPWRNPVPMLTNGTGLYVTGADFGATVATAEAGAVALTSTSGTLTVGDAWIYGWDRLGTGGFPPIPAYRERITITAVVGTAITISTPLLHRYDAAAPELTVGGVVQAGAARVIMLDRAAGAYAQHIEMDSLRVFDVEMIANPGWSYVVNGVPGFGGARSIYLEGVKAPKMNVSSCDYFYAKRIQCAGDFEVDKMLGEVIFDDCDIHNIVGLGASVVRYTGGTRIHNASGVAPMELLDIGTGTRINAKNSGGDRPLIGHNSFGSAKVIIDSPNIAVSNVTSDRVFEIGKFDWTPTITSTTQLTSTRAAFDTSGWFKQIRVGSVIYAGSLPVAEVTRMPWVPSGVLLTGDVAVGYKLLGGAIAAATVLSLPIVADVEVRGGLRLEGPYARNVTSFLGSDDQAAGVKLARIRTPTIRTTGFEFDSRIAELARGNNRFQENLGSGFLLKRLDVIVSRVAVDAGGVALQVFGLKADGTLAGMIGSVDLKTLGRNELVQSGSSGLTGRGATVLGGTATVTIASPGVVTFNSHGLSNNQTVVLRTTGALPTGLSVLTLYYARNVTANTFELSLTSGGASINTSGAQSGVHSIYGLPIDPIVAAVAIDGTNQGLAEGNRAHWMIVGEGSFL